MQEERTGYHVEVCGEWIADHVVDEKIARWADCLCVSDGGLADIATRNFEGYSSAPGFRKQAGRNIGTTGCHVQYPDSSPKSLREVTYCWPQYAYRTTEAIDAGECRERAAMLGWVEIGVVHEFWNPFTVPQS
jgi:hypothetical protein